jgi:hypothetical protein
MTSQAPTRLALVLALLCYGLLAGGWYWSVESGIKAIRLLGFLLGGMVSVPTLVLCIYYLRYRAVTTFGVKTALAVSSVYAAVFLLFFAALFSELPVAHKWATYAF